MTRRGSLGYGNVSSNAVVRLNTAARGPLSANTARNGLEASRPLERWRRAFGAGSIGMSVGRRIPIRARVAHQLVLDEFAVIAKKCRKRRRLSIEAVAQHSGIPAKRVEQFERGAVAASEREIERLSAVYGVGASVITRRLKRVFDQFAGDDDCFIENILRLKLSKIRKAASGHISPQSAAIASKCRRAREGAHHELTMADRPAFLPPTLGDSILAECIQLLALTTCIQAFVANVGTLILVQRGRNFPQPAGAGAEMKAIRMMNSDDLLALVHADLEGMVDRLDRLTLRYPAHTGAAAEFTHPQGIGDVVPFPDQEIPAECARIAEAIDLIALFKTHPALPHQGHSETHVPIGGTESTCTAKVSHAQNSMSALNRAIDLLSEAGYNLFELSGHCI